MKKTNTNKDSLGDRIKRYESVSHYTLTRRTPVFIRVDGRAFHTYTKALNRPYDEKFIRSMMNATVETAKEMSGFKLAYHQSDEVTFMLLDTDELETEPWFDNDLSKIVSITAATFTKHFNKTMRDLGLKFDKEAVFDARAFNVPIEDAPNVFIWRQRDWEKNSVQMYARTFFSQKQLDGKKIPEMKEMIKSVGKNFDMLNPIIKYGSFIKPEGMFAAVKLNYEQIEKIYEKKN